MPDTAAIKAKVTIAESLTGYPPQRLNGFSMSHGSSGFNPSKAGGSRGNREWCRSVEANYLKSWRILYGWPMRIKLKRMNILVIALSAGPLRGMPILPSHYQSL